MTVTSQLADFVSYISSEKGLALNTIEAYERDIKAFSSHLRSLGISSFAYVDKNHIVSFLSSMKTESYATASICRALIAIKVLFRFLMREGIVQSNVALYLQTPKLWQLIPEVLTHEEVETLLEQPDTTTTEGARDKAILEVLYASGLRVSEVCSLDIHSVDDTFIRVMGKGSKERVVPIGKPAVSAIDQYISFHRSEVNNDIQKALFLSSRGNRIDRSYVLKMIKNYAKQAGIKKNVSPHTMRHSFATHLLDNGADLRVIQEMLGHASISSTDRYTHISSVKLQQSFENFHPRMDVS